MRELNLRSQTRQQEAPCLRAMTSIIQVCAFAVHRWCQKHSKGSVALQTRGLLHVAVSLHVCGLALATECIDLPSMGYCISWPEQPLWMTVPVVAVALPCHVFHPSCTVTPNAQPHSHT
jgi:hypothetical protein